MGRAAAWATLAARGQGLRSLPPPSRPPPLAPRLSLSCLPLPRKSPPLPGEAPSCPPAGGGAGGGAGGDLEGLENSGGLFPCGRAPPRSPRPTRVSPAGPKETRPELGEVGVRLRPRRRAGEAGEAEERGARPGPGPGKEGFCPRPARRPSAGSVSRLSLPTCPRVARAAPKGSEPRSSRPSAPAASATARNSRPGAGRGLLAAGRGPERVPSWPWGRGAHPPRTPGLPGQEGRPVPGCRPRRAAQASPTPSEILCGLFCGVSALLRGEAPQRVPEPGEARPAPLRPCRPAPPPPPGRGERRGLGACRRRRTRSLLQLSPRAGARAN